MRELLRKVDNLRQKNIKTNTKLLQIDQLLKQRHDFFHPYTTETLRNCFVPFFFFFLISFNIIKSDKSKCNQH